MMRRVRKQSESKEVAETVSWLVSVCFVQRRSCWVVICDFCPKIEYYRKLVQGTVLLWVVQFGVVVPRSREMIWHDGSSVICVGSCHIGNDKSLRFWLPWSINIPVDCSFHGRLTSQFQLLEHSAIANPTPMEWCRITLLRASRPWFSHCVSVVVVVIIC